MCQGRLYDLALLCVEKETKKLKKKKKKKKKKDFDHIIEQFASVKARKVQ